MWLPLPTWRQKEFFVVTMFHRTTSKIISFTTIFTQPCCIWHRTLTHFSFDLADLSFPRCSQSFFGVWNHQFYHNFHTALLHLAKDIDTFCFLYKVNLLLLYHSSYFLPSQILSSSFCPIYLPPSRVVFSPATHFPKSS